MVFAHLGAKMEHCIKLAQLEQLLHHCLIQLLYKFFDNYHNNLYGSYFGALLPYSMISPRSWFYRYCNSMTAPKFVLSCCTTWKQILLLSWCINICLIKDVKSVCLNTMPYWLLLHNKFNSQTVLLFWHNSVPTALIYYNASWVWCAALQTSATVWAGWLLNSVCWKYHAVAVTTNMLAVCDRWKHRIMGSK